MSTLSQFFGGGGGGSIPAQVLLVDGGHGASCCCSTYNTGPGYIARCIALIQGRGGTVSSVYFNISPGVTCPITVGFAGTSVCRTTNTGNLPISPYSGGGTYSITYCYGGSGCASKFGNFGGVDRPQPATVCGINIPYGADYSQIAGINPFAPVDTCRLSTISGSDGTCFGAAGLGPYASYTYMTGHSGGLCNSVYKEVAGPSIPISGRTSDIYGSRGYVSKITGTVQSYGESKDMSVLFTGGPYGVSLASGGLNALSGFCSIPHPSSIGTGSGHGAYFCNSSACTVSACPGTVIIQYPDYFNSSTTSSPNVCDCSPATPGYRTYRFLCPGSITFP